MRRHGMEALVLDVTTDLEVPAAAVLSYGGGNWRAGFGADLDPEVALQRAFGSLRSVDAETLAPHWQRLRTLPQQPMAAMEPLAKTDPIDTWRVHLQRVGRQAAWADITPPDVMASGVVVVRAFLSRPA